MNGRWSSWATGRRLVGLAFLASLLVVTGCKSRGSVSGKVTFKNAPLPGGQAIFTSASGGPGGSSPINPEDGSYAVTDLPTGTYKVAVQPIKGPVTGTPGAGGRGGIPKGVRFGPPKDTKLPEGVDPKTFDPTSRPGGKPVAIPPKYEDPETSGWTFEVKKGPNTHDITVPES